MNDCRAVLEGNTLILENSRIRRTFDWNGGHLVSREIADKAAGHTWTLAGEAPDCSFPGEAAEATDGALRVTDCPATPIRPAHLQADVTMRLGGLEILRRFRIYPDCPAIACDFYLRGRPSAGGARRQRARPAWRTSRASPRCTRARRRRSCSTGCCLPQKHLRLECVQFFDVTDRRNTLVTTRSILPYRFEARLPGNLLLIRDRAGRSRACSSSRKRPAPTRSLPGPAAISSPRSAKSRRWASGWSRATSIPAIKIAWSGRAGMAAWSAWQPAANTACSRRCGRIRSRSASTSPAATR